MDDAQWGSTALNDDIPDEDKAYDGFQQSVN